MNAINAINNIRLKYKFNIKSKTNDANQILYEINTF